MVPLFGGSWVQLKLCPNSCAHKTLNKQELDEKFHIDGSIRLVADSIYLVLQIPVMLLYINFLRQQLPITSA